MAGPQSEWPRPFGRYTLLAPLAQGGMGEVCLAMSGRLSGAERLCVVKTIRPDLAGDPEFLGRFMDEGRVVCALTHPNIAQTIEVGVEGDVPFVAMEYVAGEDLDRILHAAQRAGEWLSVNFVITVIAGVLDGLAYAHRATSLDGTPLNLVHRDISPQNVRISWEGDVKVLDFGTARAAVRQTRTVHGVVFGKPGYMAPEQARGEDLDMRADLYALGIVTWELLAGTEMARDRTDKHMESLAHGEVVIPPIHGMRKDVPKVLDDWIEQMTQFEREHRFPDALTARRALMHAARERKLRIDREVVVDVLNRVLPDERDTSRSYVTALVAQGRAARFTGELSAVHSPAKHALRRVQTAASPEVTETGVIAGTRYRVGALLGAGGMGEVYAAEHADLGRAVALKILYPNHSQDHAVTRRFRMEARAIASLSHPNLVQVLDFGTTADGRLFYAMERLNGETLRECLRNTGRLSPAETVRVGAAVARGLAAAHAAGLVHRDLKPENIFLVRDGGVKLLDFGVAKATDPALLGGVEVQTTRAGELFGSPAYMAPEQASGRPVDARTDIYALGVVLYECLTGTPVFEGATMVEVLARQLAEAPKPISERAPDAGVPPALEEVVMNCLAKDPGRRPQSATDLAERLERALALGVESGALPVAVQTTSDVAPLVVGVGRGPKLLLGAAVAVAMAAAGVAFVKILLDDAGAASRQASVHSTQVGGSGQVATPAPAPHVTNAPAAHDVPPVQTNTTQSSVQPVQTNATQSNVQPAQGVPPVQASRLPAGASQANTPAVNTNGGTSLVHRAGDPASVRTASEPRRPSAAQVMLIDQGNPTTSAQNPLQAREQIQNTTSAATTTPREDRELHSSRTPPASRVDHYALARQALDARDHARAIAEANEAISHGQNTVAARILLGQAQMRSGHRAEAIAAWRLVLARDPGNEEARRLLRAAGENPDQF